MMERVIVIGGGASGMTAAISAASLPGRKVTLLERQQRPGRKLLATGNGRCNITNSGAGPERYHGEDPDFPRFALERFTPRDTLEFFRSLGLVCTEEYGGRVYPMSDSANSVLDVLRFALSRSGVELRCSTRAEAVRREGGGFRVDCEGAESLFADKLIVACGGAAGGKLGGVTDGYELLKSLGHRRTKLYPALVQLVTAPEYPRALKGVRAQASIDLRRGGEVLAQSRGELQFTETGVSGPAAFDVSRAASVCGGGAELVIDLLGPISPDELFALLLRRRSELPALEAGELLTGVLHNRLGRMMVKYSGLSGASPVGSLTDAELRRVVRSCSAFTLELRGTAGFDSAQVTAGGVATADFDPRTLESRIVPGLFACGEVLDVDGDCGGYNLQWAWASGALAGRLGE